MEDFHAKIDTEKHAYILLAYEKNGKTIKKYFDPTSYIVGGSLEMEKDKIYGNKENEIWVKNEDESKLS